MDAESGGDYPYPTDQQERMRREHLQADRDVLRVLRGGAFDDSPQARAVCLSRQVQSELFGQGASGFGWWCAQPFSFSYSGLCSSGLWGESRGVLPSGCFSRYQIVINTRPRPTLG